MVFSQRELEGYVRIDNRESPGIPGSPLHVKGSMFEGSTLTCGHFPCQAIVIINPARRRERAHCYSCNHYICDACAALRDAGVPCQTLNKFIDEHLKLIAKGANHGT